MNTLDVADAIAARFSGITAGGVGLALGPTARLPDNVTRTPALLVYPPEGSLGLTMSLRDDTLTFPVRLLLTTQAEAPRTTAALYAWYDAMRDQVGKQMTLGLAYVAWAQPVSMRIELAGQPYEGVPFDVVEIMVEVRFNEAVTTLAP